MSSSTAALNPDITTWNVAATVTASQYPDRGVGVFRYKHLLLAVGQDSIEFFSDTGNPPPGSLLTRTDQAFIKFGAIHPKLAVNVDDVFYWVAYGSTDTIGVWKLEGYVPSKISTSKEDSQLTLAANSIGYASYFTMDAILLNAKKHLIINGVNTYSMLYGATPSDFSVSDTFTITPSTDGKANILAYNITDNMWWAINMCNANCYIMPTTAYPTSLSSQQFQQYFFRRTANATGNDQVSSMQPFKWTPPQITAGTWYDDNPIASPTSQAISVAITFNTIWAVTSRRKFLRRITAIIDTLVKYVLDSNTYSMYFLYNKTGNVGNTGDITVRQLSVTPSTPSSTVVTGQQRYYINNCGAFRQLNLALVWKSEEGFRMKAMELNLAGGTH
jgi:hypothetical protein